MLKCLDCLDLLLLKDMQHAVSTTATEAKDPHYDTIREEPRVSSTYVQCVYNL